MIEGGQCDMEKTRESGWSILAFWTASSLRCQPEQTPETVSYAELVEQESPFQPKSPASGHFEVEGRLARDVF